MLVKKLRHEKTVMGSVGMGQPISSTDSAGAAAGAAAGKVVVLVAVVVVVVVVVVMVVSAEAPGVGFPVAPLLLSLPVVLAPEEEG
jgi:t-SNARE complex subunit (syntaxin)